jgi:hypothetical protein
MAQIRSRLISRVLDFVAEGSAAGEPAALADASLEQDLFNPEGRW